jgi:hypothetical protein
VERVPEDGNSNGEEGSEEEGGQAPAPDEGP